MIKDSHRMGEVRGDFRRVVSKDSHRMGEVCVYVGGFQTSCE